MLIPKKTYIRSPKHRRFIASLPCLVTGSKDVQAAHIRKGNYAGTALKSCDTCCVPLSVEQHALQGQMGEEKFWAKHGGYKRAARLANDLYKVSGDEQKAMRLIVEWRNEIYNL